MNRLAQLDGAGTAFEWGEAVGFSRAPFVSLSAGPFSPVAGPNGLAIGAFCWLDPDTGQASNSFSPGTLMGFVLPLANPYNAWQRTFVQHGPPFAQMLIRPGVGCVLAASGCVKAKFPNGGQAGARVYADPNTGLPYMQTAALGAIVESSDVATGTGTLGGAGANAIVEPPDVVAGIGSTGPTLIPTPWVILRGGAPGARLPISTFSQSFN